MVAYASRSDEKHDSQNMNSSHFHTTHWSVVLSARGNDTGAKAALAELCETYYAPVLQFIRRETQNDSARRYGGRDAEDLTHDFFTQLLQGKMFASLQREGARFRIYLLASVRLFLSQLRVRESAQKRGGGTVQTALPEDPPEKTRCDEAVFDGDWARGMVRRAIETLKKETTEDETPNVRTKSLLPYLRAEMNSETRAKLAQDWGVGEVAVKVALHRLRKRFRETIRSQIAETLAQEADIEDELAYLIAVLRRQPPKPQDTVAELEK